MKLEFLILTTSGPYAGEDIVADREAACQALSAGVRAAFGPAFTTEHDQAVNLISAGIRSAEELPFSYRTTAVSVTLSP